MGAPPQEGRPSLCLAHFGRRSQSGTAMCLWVHACVLGFTWGSPLLLPLSVLRVP